MKIKLETVFENTQGGDMTEPTQGEKGAMTFPVRTLRTTLIQALAANCDATLPVKLLRFEVYKKIRACEGPDVEMEVTAKEVTMLQELCGEVYRSPLIVGQAHALLEG